MRRQDAAFVFTADEVGTMIGLLASLPPAARNQDLSLDQLAVFAKLDAMRAADAAGKPTSWVVTP